MPPVILVHGAWHGGWCWEKVKAALEAKGFEVHAPTLPGHDQPSGAPADTSLEDYGRAIADLADSLVEPPLLVGHSMGGGVVSQAAALTPRLAGILILAGFALRDGESILALAGEGPDQDLGGNMVWSEDGGHVTVQPEAVNAVFYADCPPDDQAKAAARLVPQAVKPFSDAMTDGQGHAGRVRKFAIVCTQDRAVDPALQRKMFERAGAKTWEMASSHSPFFSQPGNLADLIAEAAREAGGAS